jgi:hypothetical protein
MKDNKHKQYKILLNHHVKIPIQILLVNIFSNQNSISQVSDVAYILIKIC